MHISSTKLGAERMVAKIHCDAKMGGVGISNYHNQGPRIRFDCSDYNDKIGRHFTVSLNMEEAERLAEYILEKKARIAAGQDIG